MELFTSVKRKYLALIFIPYIILLFNHFDTIRRKSVEINSFNTAKYLVDTKNCKISDIDPFNSDIWPYFRKEEYMPCSNLELLTYIEHNDRSVYLKVNQTLLASYSSRKIYCCYSNITRGNKDIDNSISISDCKSFHESVKISKDLIKVTCVTDFNQEIYSNVHSIIFTMSEMNNKSYNENSNKKPYNVLLVGIDTMSQQNLIRTMPNTHTFLENNDWIKLKGYNKIDDNTFPNLMAILTGMNLSQIYESCNPEKYVLNNCDFIWKYYRKSGYATAYAEDEVDLNTFNYLFKGFKDTPTDFYFRPYFLALNTLPITKKYLMSYCTGPENSGERILNLINGFSTLQNLPKFGLFWMNSFSHNNINTASGMDDVFRNFFNRMKNDVLNNTVIIFFSDHGFRFGKIRYTYSGWLEERLPFNYIWIPESFRQAYPKKFKNLKKNSEKLTTPYDFYMTLQDILSLSDQNYQVRPSLACPNCKSLFSEISDKRSCSNVSISQHLCTCMGHLYIDPNTNVVQLAASFILNKLRNTINSFVNESKQCADYYLRNVISSAITETFYNSKNETVNYLLIIFQTYPTAVFEGTVSVSYKSVTIPTFSLEGIISRVDRYGDTSKCVNNPILRKYCYCDNTFTKFKKTMNILFNN